MNNKKFLTHLKRIGACNEAIDWVKEHGGTATECWNDCERGDWMAWLIAYDAKKLHITKRQLVGALADCAALSLKHYEAEYPHDKRMQECINICRRYAEGKATDKELINYATYAHFAASVPYAAYTSATYAAYAAAYAAYAASTASAANGAYAAYTSATYAAYTSGYGARFSTLKKCANIFRKHFPEVLA
jgi:hypothetical protein